MNNPCNRGEHAAHMDFAFTSILVFVRIRLGAWSYIVKNNDKSFSVAYRTPLPSNPLKRKVKLIFTYEFVSISYEHTASPLQGPIHDCCLG